jgi:nanoRNase/pAp phosphatase (c-di-AMP/oligoRNAs hydrolase)
MILDNIKEEIEKANTVVILTHESPDGDAVRKFACNVSCTC